MNTETPSTATMILPGTRFFYLGYVATRNFSGVWLITHPSHPSFAASAPTIDAAKEAIDDFVFMDDEWSGE